MKLTKFIDQRARAKIENISYHKESGVLNELVEMMFALELIGIHHEHRQGILFQYSKNQRKRTEVMVTLV